jgi:lysophospholipase L1-like esterase
MSRLTYANKLTYFWYKKQPIANVDAPEVNGYWVRKADLLGMVNFNRIIWFHDSTGASIKLLATTNISENIVPGYTQTNTFADIGVSATFSCLAEKNGWLYILQKIDKKPANATTVGMGIYAANPTGKSGKLDFIGMTQLEGETELLPHFTYPEEVSEKTMLDVEVSRKVANMTTSEAKESGFGMNVDNGLREWRTSLYNPLKNLLLIGDSVTEGYNATDRQTNSWASLLRDKLQAKYGAGGLGFQSPLRDVYTFNGDWQTYTNFGVSNSARYATGTANKITFTLPGDNYDIYVQGASNAGAFTVQIDSDTPIAITPTTANVAEKHTVATNTYGTHTVTITAPATGYIYFLGASSNKGNTGVRVHNTGKGGAVIADVSYGNRKDFIKAINPDLTIIAMTINDFQYQTPIATYRERMVIVIEEALKYGSVMVISSNQMNKANPIPQKEYEAVLIELCKLYGCAFLSIYDRWKDYTTASFNNTSIFFLLFQICVLQLQFRVLFL